MRGHYANRINLMHATIAGTIGNMDKTQNNIITAHVDVLDLIKNRNVIQHEQTLTDVKNITAIKQFNNSFLNSIHSNKG